MFVSIENNEYVFNFVDLFSARRVCTISQHLRIDGFDPAPLLANLDRTPAKSLIESKSLMLSTYHSDKHREYLVLIKRGGYNFTQDAVLGIRPPTGDAVVPATPTLTQTGSLAAYIENDSLVFDLFASNSAMWVNYTPQNLVAEFGATFHNENNTAASDFTLPLSEKGYEVPSGIGLSTVFKPDINLAEADIPDGRYKVTIVNKYESISDDWTPVLINNGYDNSFGLSLKGGTPGL